jgi:hypothetical protein
MPGIVIKRRQASSSRNRQELVVESHERLSQLLCRQQRLHELAKVRPVVNKRVDATVEPHCSNDATA